MITQLDAAAAVELMRERGMRINPETLRDGLMDRRFPFGDCFKTSNGHVRCIIYKSLLLRWLDEREDEKPKKEEAYGNGNYRFGDVV